MGVTCDDDGVSRLPNGDYAVCCTSCAERIIELAESDRAAFDLNEPADRARVLELFADSRTWTRRIEANAGEFSWLPAMPSQFAALARSF